MPTSHVDRFLNNYVRIDDGTAVLLCFHTSSAQCAAWVYVGCTLRRAEPTTICFSKDDALVAGQVVDVVAKLHERTSVRRVVVIVCEPDGPSLVKVLEGNTNKRPKQEAFFRIGTKRVPAESTMGRH